MKTPLFALPDALLIPTVQAALLEDLGRRGDVTSAAVIAKIAPQILPSSAVIQAFWQAWIWQGWLLNVLIKQSTLAQMPQMGMLSNQVKCWLMYRAIPKPYYKPKEQR